MFSLALWLVIREPVQAFTPSADPMRLARAFTLLLLAALTLAAGRGQQRSPADRPWPPGVHEVPAESPPLAPDQALQTFYMPPGYRLELVASEPMVQDPVAIDWDPAGRLWVVEMPGYMRDIAGGHEHDPLGRIVVLEDRDGDGLMDRRTVFADGLVMARAVKVLERGVLVGEPPNVWLMRDTDGDLESDTRELVTDLYGRREIDPQNNANAFFWAMDNRMHAAGQADIALRLKDGAFEVMRTLRRGQWGVTQDDAGRLYRNTNESALHVDLVPTMYYARNPNLLRTRGSYERLANDNPDLNVVWPVRPTPATNRAYQFGILRPDGSLARFTAVCAPLVYRGDRLPPELSGNVFVAEPAANLVSRIAVEDDGRFLRARKAYARGEFLASTDERFRPVFLSNAPDGTLYVVDMYRGVLEHRLSMTEYLRDRILARHLAPPIGMGRIYRVVHETTRRDTTRLAQPPSGVLVSMLAHPNGWWRDTAQRLLVERADRSVAPELARLADSAADWRTRLHALWTLDGLDAIEAGVVTRALRDVSRDVRVGALRIAERWLGEPDHPVQPAVLALVQDDDWAVRRQLAASMGAAPSGIRSRVLVEMLDAHADDPITLDAAISGLRGAEASVLEDLIEKSAAETPARAAAIAMLAATSLRAANEADAQRVLALIAEGGRPRWQRSAILHGAEIAMLGGSMPGTPPPRPAAADAPCPTCPGGRAGPGGAYAYPRPAAASASSERRLVLAREPEAFTALGARDDEVGRRVAALLSRISWPGKPGESAPPRPLSRAEQELFDAGREVYANICQACHQPDGRGQGALAPPVAGSAYTRGPAGALVRILLQGKEGSFGLMPPVGSTLDDRQVAAVLTYVRREWGQSGRPIDPATVTAVRALTADRTRPWTDAELLTLGAAPVR